MDAQQRAAEGPSDGLAASQSEPAAPPAPAPSDAIPPLSLSHLLLRSPSLTSSLPLHAMSATQRMQHAGLTGRVGSRTVLLPGGLRALRHIQQLVDDELATVQAQEVEIGAEVPAPLPSRASGRATQRQPQASPASSDAPYPASLAHELPLLTQLLVPEFGAAARSSHRMPLTRAALRTRVSHAAADPSGAFPALRSLFSGAKHTLDYLCMDTSRWRAMESYQRLMDGCATALRHAGCEALVVEASPLPTGMHGVDADLAHELHVVSHDSAAGTKGHPSSHGAVGVLGGLLKCDTCDYAAKRERAVSKLEGDGPAAHSSSSSLSATASPQHLPPPLQRFFRAWVVDHMRNLLPAHALEQMQLDPDSSQWKCELLVPKDAVSGSMQAGVDVSDAGTGASLPLVHLLLLRSEDELNLHALAEHVGGTEQQLVRVETADLAARILSRTLTSDALPQLMDALPDTLRSSVQASVQAALPPFDPRPELLVDQSLLPAGLDLDLALMQQQEAREEEEEEQARMQAEQEVREEEEERARAGSSSAALDVVSPAVHARLERSLLSSAAKLRAGESIDLVAMELQAKGVDVQRAQADMIEEAARLQREQHEQQEREREEEESREASQAQLEAEESEDGVDFSMADHADESGSGPLPPSSSGSFSSSAFSYSLQGSFRLSQPGDACVMSGCKGGHLISVRTHVVANSVFIGRQMLEQPQEQEEAPGTARGRGKAVPAAAPTPKRQYVHSGHLRFSPYDTLALLVQHHLHAPAVHPSARPTAAGTASVSLDSLTRLQLPALLAPYQLALVPVTSEAAAAPVANPRDLHRTRTRSAPSAAESKAADERTMAQAQRLYADLLALSHSPPSDAQAAAGLPPDFFPPLGGSLLLDDRTGLPVNARVQALVGMGVPVLVLLQPRALASGYVSLLINRPGVSLQPRRVSVEGLAPLLLQMLRAAHAPRMRSRSERRQKDQQDGRGPEEGSAPMHA